MSPKPRRRSTESQGAEHARPTSPKDDWERALLAGIDRPVTPADPMSMAEILETLPSVSLTEEQRSTGWRTGRTSVGLSYAYKPGELSFVPSFAMPTRSAEAEAVGDELKDSMVEVVHSALVQRRRKIDVSRWRGRASDKLRLSKEGELTTALARLRLAHETVFRQGPLSSGAIQELTHAVDGAVRAEAVSFITDASRTLVDDANAARGRMQADVYWSYCLPPTTLDGDMTDAAEVASALAALDAQVRARGWRTHARWRDGAPANDGAQPAPHPHPRRRGRKKGIAAAKPPTTYQAGIDSSHIVVLCIDALYLERLATCDVTDRTVQEYIYTLNARHNRVVPLVLGAHFEPATGLRFPHDVGAWRGPAAPLVALMRAGSGVCAVHPNGVIDVDETAARLDQLLRLKMSAPTDTGVNFFAPDTGAVVEEAPQGGDSAREAGGQSADPLSMHGLSESLTSSITNLRRPLQGGSGAPYGFASASPSSSSQAANALPSTAESLVRFSVETPPAAFDLSAFKLLLARRLQIEARTELLDVRVLPSAERMMVLPTSAAMAPPSAAPSTASISSMSRGSKCVEQCIVQTATGVRLRACINEHLFVRFQHVASSSTSSSAGDTANLPPLPPRLSAAAAAAAVARAAIHDEAEQSARASMSATSFTTMTMSASASSLLPSTSKNTSSLTLPPFDAARREKNEPHPAESFGGVAVRAARKAERAVGAAVKRCWVSSHGLNTCDLRVANVEVGSLLHPDSTEHTSVELLLPHHMALVLEVLLERRDPALKGLNIRAARIRPPQRRAATSRHVSEAVAAHSAIGRTKAMETAAITHGMMLRTPLASSAGSLLPMPHPAIRLIDGNASGTLPNQPSPLDYVLPSALHLADPFSRPVWHSKTGSLSYTHGVAGGSWGGPPRGGGLGGSRGMAHSGSVSTTEWESTRSSVHSMPRIVLGKVAP